MSLNLNKIKHIDPIKKILNKLSKLSINSSISQSNVFKTPKSSSKLYVRSEKEISFKPNKQSDFFENQTL